MSHYKITPLQKKSIRNIYELERENEDGTTSELNIIELYRFGFGFVESEDDLPCEGDSIAYANSNSGENEGSDLDDSISCEFEYSDDISEEERESIENLYVELGGSWVYDGDHSWQVKNDYLEIDSPYKVEHVDKDGVLIEELFTS